jgi:hypothetical protein
VALIQCDNDYLREGCAAEGREAVAAVAGALYNLTVYNEVGRRQAQRLGYTQEDLREMHQADDGSYGPSSRPSGQNRRNRQSYY